MTLRDHHRTLTYGGWAIGLGGLLSGVMPAVLIGGLMLALGQYYALSNLTGSSAASRVQALRKPPHDNSRKIPYTVQ